MTDPKDINEEDLIRRIDAERDGVAPLVPAPEEETRTRGEWTKQDAAMRLLYGPIAQEPVPERLSALVDRAAAEEAIAADTLGTSILSVPREGSAGQPGMFRLAAAIVLLAVGAALGFTAARLSEPSVQELTLAQSALMAHRTFSPEVVHPVEVAASDESHLTTWMTKRVGLPVRPPDLGAQGFHLVGGRVLPDENGAAAAMLYEDGGGRRVTVYVAPVHESRETALRLVQGEGTEGWWWVGHGFGCAVVGDAPRDVLKVMAGKAYETLGG